MKYHLRLPVLKWNTFTRVDPYIDSDRVKIFHSNGHVHRLIVSLPDRISLLPGYAYNA